MTPQNIVLKYSSEAMWLNSDAQWRALLSRLLQEIALLYKKDIYDFAIDDLHRLVSDLQSSSQKLGIEKVSFYQIRKIESLYKRYALHADVISFIYSVLRLFTGSAGPITRKLGFSISGKRAVYFSLTYLAGYYMCEFYGGKNFKTAAIEYKGKAESDPLHDFDPIFNYLNETQIKDLLLLLKLKADINDDLTDIKLKIIDRLRSDSKHVIKHVIDKQTKSEGGYSEVLFSICSEYSIEEISGLGVEELEEKIVQRIFQQTLSQIDETKQRKLLGRLKKFKPKRRLPELFKKGGLVTALIGARLSRQGVYLAAASVLGAISKGLGVTLAYGVSATLSSIVAAVTGPYLIGSAAISLAGTFLKSNPQKCVPAVIYIALQRQALYLEDEKRKLRPLRRKVRIFLIFAAGLILGAALLYYFLHFLVA